MKIMQKDTITSLELLEQINFFRKKERDLKNDCENRLLAEIGHDGILKTIRDEFCEEISLGELNESKYTNDRGREYPMFVLSLDYAKQILLRESKYVRKAVIAYIRELESTIKALQDKTLDKKQQLEAMKR
jgi:phage regulator Rha-like protein